MELNKSQWRYVNSKTLGHQFLKGGEFTGKTTAAVYRIINLENNYRLFQNENIVYVVLREEDKKNIQEIYENAKLDLNYRYDSLFSYFNKGFEILTLNELIEIYSQGYMRVKKVNYKFSSEEKEYTLLKDLLADFKLTYKKSKLIANTSLEFLLKEIKWIKASGFTKDEYMNIDRKGRDKRIKKNSLSREGIYYLKDRYNSALRENNLMDKWDNILFALEFGKNFNKTYTHIILDNCEALTLAEIRFINSLLVMEKYSSLTYVLGENKESRENTWFIKGRKYNVLDETLINRSFLLKNSYKTKKQSWNSIEEFRFINLRNKIFKDFSRDTASNEKELVIKEGDQSYIYNEGNLKEYPLFSNIAAGEPILMNENVEDSFLLPEDWIRNSKDVFLLKVKGDSMENINILNGDLVVIRKQATADHNDIVAVDIDRSSTLKRLDISGESPLLMPENEKYEPISLEGRDANILGVAIGIIKKLG